MADINENVYISEDSDNVEIIETVEVIEVSEPTSYTIDSAEAFPALGESNERLKHQLLNGRELADQHPITSITGLRDELDGIEALQTVYSNERNQANYYLWQDENVLQENRVGYFVSACSDINEIEICTSDNEIFGVTVDSAGFIGAQSDVARDIKYGLVVNTGIVHVRCELPVEVGDHVISNDYGYAKKNDNGYKVVGRHRMDDVEYAEIILVTPMSQICTLTDNFNNVSLRMNDAEKNIVSAINVANAAYNKAGEANSVSEDAVKDALEALKKSEETSEIIKDLEDDIAQNNVLATEARKIAEDASNAAITAKDTAIKTSNEALTNVNNLVKDLEPITTWEDAASGNTGAKYLTTYIKEGLATKVEVQTVENLTEENKSAIEKNAEGIRTMVSSVDKYSVGEFSQSYGLTQEQAASILTNGMVYIPTKHNDGDSHSETFADTKEVNEFTPGYYYIWDGNDWLESSSPLVAFFSEELAPSNALQYWYIDSNKPPEGYEAHALYINQDGQWTKVNILDGNVNNRITSMIRQTADKIAIDVANAQGDITSHQQWLDDNSANIQGVVSWKSDVEDDVSQIATIKQTADDVSASVALVVEKKDDKDVIKTASIVTAINESGSEVAIEADKILINGTTTFLNSWSSKDDKTCIDGGKIYANSVTATQIDATNLKVDAANITGELTIGQLPSTIAEESDIPTKVSELDNDSGYTDETKVTTITEDTIKTTDVIAENLQVKAANIDGLLTATQIDADGIEAENAKISGNITATSGKIGNLFLQESKLFSVANPTNSIVSGMNGFYHGNSGNTIFLWAGAKDQGSTYNDTIAKFGNEENWNGAANVIKDANNGAKFYVTHTGELHATKATISGVIEANTILQNGIKVGATQNTFFEDWDTNYTRWASTRGSEFSQIVMGYGASPRIELTAHTNHNASTGIEITSKDGALQGTWYEDSGAAITSDLNKKNSIEKLSDNYGILFDNLKPIRYKYNNGTSDRYHTGFIAQDVEQAVLNSGLTTNEFAGFVMRENDGYYLRYEEFIALNTLEIQKLKARITELEEKLKEK